MLFKVNMPYAFTAINSSDLHFDCRTLYKLHIIAFSTATLLLFETFENLPHLEFGNQKEKATFHPRKRNVDTLIVCKPQKSLPGRRQESSQRPSDYRDGTLRKKQKEKMSSDLKMEILTGLVSLTLDLGFGGRYGHVDTEELQLLPEEWVALDWGEERTLREIARYKNEHYLLASCSPFCHKLSALQPYRCSFIPSPDVTPGYPRPQDERLDDSYTYRLSFSKRQAAQCKQ
ncbi:hypothetical protein MJG53_017351 [Ovis ammon polii x Ovis aries]|uniref:Uncharacterized protein n=1 Tax=Ovis ammon polii x Ovis aries TaxID=2918886 RepID=A0ACB9U7P7_9CETA|nr:hypothetical protein MJG53_017351 [Ovis ammon polii x Ovis aries]